MPPATWLAAAFSGNVGNTTSNGVSYWPTTVFITGLAASMAVNALVTGMIVFRILKVTGDIRPTSVERTLGLTKGNKFRHIMFVIIESGMALFAIQLVRVVVAFILSVPVEKPILGLEAAYDIVVGINQMLNVIIQNLFISTSLFC